MTSNPLTTTTNLDLEIQTSLETLNEDFFTAISGDEQQLQIFSESWAGLSDRIEISRSHLHPETLEKATSFMKVVDTVVSSILQLDNDVSNLFSKLTLEESAIVEPRGTLKMTLKCCI